MLLAELRFTILLWAIGVCLLLAHCVDSNSNESSLADAAAASPINTEPIQPSPGGYGGQPNAATTVDTGIGNTPSNTESIAPENSTAGNGVPADAGNVVIDTGVRMVDSGSAFVDAASSGDAISSSDAIQPDQQSPPIGTFSPVTDLEAAGPYSPNTINNSGPTNSYTVYHPVEMAPQGAKNPIVSWGNGGSTTPSWYTLLPHLASHGFVVAASNNIFVSPEELIAGVDWLVAENDRPDSDFYQKLDTTHIAIMGYSFGSDSTFSVADDPRLTTTVHISGGSLSGGVSNLIKPAAFFCGDPPVDGLILGDMARPQCDNDFTRATVPVFYGVFTGGSHLGVMTSPFMERIRIAVTGWLRWHLMGDESHKSLFVGVDCGLCTDPNWSVQQKNLN